MVGRLVGYLKMKRYVLYNMQQSSAGGKRVTPAVQPRDWLIGHTRAQCCLWTKSPCHVPDLVSWINGCQRHSSPSGRDPTPGNLGQRTASRGQYLAAELMGAQWWGLQGRKNLHLQEILNFFFLILNFKKDGSVIPVARLPRGSWADYRVSTAIIIMLGHSEAVPG